MKVVSQLVLTFLLNASWQIALVTAFAVLCAWVLRGTSARYRHALWVSALVMSVSLPVLSCVRLIKAFSVSTEPQAQTTMQPRVQTILEPIVVDPISSTRQEPIMSPAARTATTSEPAGEGRAISAIRLNGNMAVALVTLYFFFLLYRGFNLFRAWLTTRNIIQSAYLCEFPKSVQAIIARCRTAIGVKHVRILWSSSVAVPITAGVINPVVILPEQIRHEVDEDLLTSAIGHEFVHVVRRDYILNLIYELIYLPLSFHPAAALLRRRIRQTRELSCDERVAEKLLRPDVYARSLVQLIGTAPLPGRAAANITIGISNTDNLEVRIMSLLRTSKPTARRRTFLLVAASLLLAAPCVAAASFTLRLEIDPQEVSANQQRKTEIKAELEALKVQQQELEERALLEGHEAAVKSLREVERALNELQQERQPDEAKIKEVEKALSEMEATLAESEKNLPESEARMRELSENLAQMEKQLDEVEMRKLQEGLKQLEGAYQGDRKARATYRVEPEYPLDAREKRIEGSVELALTIDPNGVPQDVQVTRPLYPSLDQSAVEAVRKWRFEPMLKNGQPASQRMTIEVVFRVDSWDQDKKKRDEMEWREKEKVDEVKWREKKQLDEKEWREKQKLQKMEEGEKYKTKSPEYEMRRSKVSQNLVDGRREERTRRQAELTNGATITMDRAIQIATSAHPGKVLACSLGREKDGQVFYHLVIINSDGEKSAATYVWVSAMDGRILKTEKEE